jgi:O-antigen ligase
VVWRLERRVPHAVSEVHSLPLEMAVELGVVGVLLFAMFVGGVISGAARALRTRAALGPGACAVCTAWLLHATIDWDWQLPAVTLPAVVLAGGLLAAAEAPEPPGPEPAWSTLTEREERVRATAAA